MKRSFILSGLIICFLLSMAAFLQASGIVPAIVPALSPSTSRRGTTTPASGAGIFQLAANTTAGSAGATICDDGNGNSTTSGCTANAVTSTTPVTVNTNTTNEQFLQELSLSAGYLNSLGRPFSIFGAGVYTTQTAQTPTLRFRAHLCTVSGCGSGTVITLIDVTSGATTAASTGLNWSVNMVSTVAASGATGNLETHGYAVVDLGALTTVADTIYGDTNSAVSGNIDLTAALFLDFSITFSTNAATANTMTQREGVINPGGSTSGGGGGSGAVTQLGQCVTGGSCTGVCSQTAAAITCTAIPGTSTDLILSTQTRSATSATSDNLQAQFNADTGSNYDFATNQQNNGSGGAAQVFAQTAMTFAGISAANSQANTPGSADVKIENYAATTFFKQSTSCYGNEQTSSFSQNGCVLSQWHNTAAVTSIKLFLSSGGNFVTGSTFTLWGIK